MRLARGSELAAIAFVVDGRRCWRRSEVDALLRRRNGAGVDRNPRRKAHE
jgi:hypothetical protein